MEKERFQKARLQIGQEDLEGTAYFKRGQGVISKGTREDGKGASAKFFEMLFNQVFPPAEPDLFLAEEIDRLRLPAPDKKEAAN